MNPAQGTPAGLQLGIFPLLGFRGEVPLPVMGDVAAVYESALWRAASRPEKQRLSRALRQRHGSTQRAVECPIPTASDGSGSVGSLHLHESAYGIAAEELSDTAAHGEFTGAENIPRKTQAGGDQGVVRENPWSTVCH